ncbi:MAG TPA: VCBS repeat-containing protein [Bryobacteraceae bacterium]
MTLAALANGNTLVAYTSQTTLKTAIASSTGTVQTTGQYTVGPTASHVIATDFNGDGNLDLAVSNFGNTDTNTGGNVAIFLGKGDGTFTAGPTANAGQTPVSMYAADFNGDGKIDLAVADLTVGSISVLLGKGDGTFQSPVAYMLAGTAGCPRNSTVSILLGKGDGTFQAPITYPTGGTTTTYLASMDLNGDGKPDLIAAAQLDTISFLFGNGDGSFQAPVEYVAGDMPEYFALFPTSSGAMVATVDGVSYDLVLMPVLPNGQAAAPQVHPLTASVSGVAAADLNGDGYPDMVAANGTLTVLIRKPGAEFAAPVSYSLESGSQAVAVALADLRGDGHNDAIAAAAANSSSATGGTVDVALGNGDGTLGAQTSYAIGGPPRRCRLWDQRRGHRRFQR